MPEAPAAIFRYFDCVAIVLAAPIMLLIGVPALGYCIGAGAWLALRAAGAGVDRVASAAGDPQRELGLRLGYMLGRLFALAIAVVIARNQGGRDDGLAALAVIVFGFTVQLGISFATRPRPR